MRLSIRFSIFVLTLGLISQALIGCSTISPEDEKKSHLLLKMGISQMEAGDYPNALRNLIQAAEINPQDASIQNNLGLAYFFRQRYDLAEQHLRRAIALQPDYTEAKNNLGRSLIELNKPSEAVAVLQNALNDLTYPKPARIHLNLGMAYFKARQFDEARAQLRKALEYGPDNCLAQTFLGRSFYETKDYRQATQILDRAVGFCKISQFDEPHYYSALAYYQLGEKQKAESRLEEVIQFYSQGKYSEQAKSMLETIRR